MSGRLTNVVVLGGSAGALPTMLLQVDRLMVPDHSCLFVIYHRAGKHPFDLQLFLPPASPYHAVEARPGLAVEVNKLYYPHRSDDLLVRDGKLVVEAPRQRYRPNLDRLFTSLAEAYGRRVVGVLLSGMGDDGVAGLAAIRRAGGLALVQDPDEAPFRTLPEAAVVAGAYDELLPTAGLLDRIERVLAGEPARQAGEPQGRSRRGERQSPTPGRRNNPMV